MYLIRRVTVTEEPAPELGTSDVLALSDAAALLGVSVQAITGAMDRGELTTILDPNSLTSYKRRRRLALRSEIEQRKARA